MTLLKRIALSLILASLCKGIKSNGHELSRQNLKHEGKMTHFFKESIPLLSSRTDLIKESHIPHNHVHQVIIVVQQNNMDKLTRILHDVSDPMSPRYGQHMSGEQIHAMTSNLEARDAIVAYLHLNGASVVSETLSGDSMTVNAPISAWERVLDTKFTMFHQLQAEGTVEMIVRAKTYSIPRELDMYIDSVLNVIDMPYRESHRQKVPTKNRFAEQDLDPLKLLRPQEIRQYYNMSDVFGSAQSTQAAVGFGPNYFSPKSLAYFQQNISYQDLQPAFNVGGYESENPADDSHEGNLDIQYIMGISRNSPTTFWHNPGGFFTWLTEVLSTPNPPLVLSISYGISELYTSLGTHRYVTNLAKKLGLMGVTLVVASGDDGAVGSDARGNPSKCSYQPYFPAGNPYFTAIGGTAVRNGPCFFSSFGITTKLRCETFIFLFLL
jgi:tripeptidyl-peptidase I